MRKDGVMRHLEVFREEVSGAANHSSKCFTVTSPNKMAETALKHPRKFP